MGTESTPLNEVIDAVLDSQLLTNLAIFVILFSFCFAIFVLSYYIIEIIFTSVILFGLYNWTQKNK